MTDDANPFEMILTRFAEKLCDAPGASRLARLARSAKRISVALLDDLTLSIEQLDDVRLVGSDIWLHLVEVGYCDARFSNAVEFVSALGKRLETYVNDGDAATAARVHFNERVGWWRMAVSRSAELCRWPAVVLMEGGTKRRPAKYKETAANS